MYIICLEIPQYVKYIGIFFFFLVMKYDFIKIGLYSCDRVADLQCFTRYFTIINKHYVICQRVFTVLLKNAM